MATLSGSTIASTYDRLLALPSGGLSGSSLVAMTDGDASATACISITDNATDKSVLSIDGSHANGTALYIDNSAADGDTLVEWQLGGTTQWLMGVEDGDSNALKICSGTTMGSAEKLSFYTSKVVFNNNNQDVDFQFKGDTGDNVLYVDGGNDRVGIGTAPAQTLHVAGITRIDGHVYFQAGSRIDLGTQDNQDLQFQTDAANVMMLKAGGNVGIGTTTPNALLEVGDVTADVDTWIIARCDTDNACGIQFAEESTHMWAVYNDGDDSDTFKITDTGNDDGIKVAQGGNDHAAVSSDERSKTNLVVISDALNKINSLRAVNYNWKYGSKERRERSNIGLIAQDVLKIAPEICIVPKKDYEVIDHPLHKGERQAKYQMTYSNSGLVPVLVKAIQELSVKVTALENA